MNIDVHCLFLPNIDTAVARSGHVRIFFLKFVRNDIFIETINY